MRTKTLIVGAFVLLSMHVNAQLNSYLNNELAEKTLNVKPFEPELYKNRIIPIFMMTMGVAMAGIWGADIASGKFSDQGNFFKWREGENLMWPHIMAEYLTAAGLIAGGIGLYSGKEWAVSVSLFSLGAVTYSAINSSGWVLADRSRTAYGIPMWVSLAGSAISFVILIN
jgi:hypothetical protein